ILAYKNLRNCANISEKKIMRLMCCLVILATFFAGSSYAREQSIKREALSVLDDKTRKMIVFPLMFKTPEDVEEEPNIRDLLDKAEKAITFIYKVYIRLMKRIINGLMG
ncbi:hypothetical protein L9F63_018956, partial [Diploptera punctata]